MPRRSSHIVAKLHRTKSPSSPSTLEPNREGADLFLTRLDEGAETLYIPDLR